MKRLQPLLTAMLLSRIFLSLLLLAGCLGEGDGDSPSIITDIPIDFGGDGDDDIPERDEIEPNDAFDNAQSVTVPVVLQGTVFHDGTLFGGTEDDRFDTFSFILSSPGTYRFTLSELQVFDIDLNVLTQEALANEIPGVNFFESPVNAPFDGPVESFQAELRAGVRYFIRVRALDTRLSDHFYTVTVEKE